MKKIDRVTELSLLYEISSIPLRLHNLDKLMQIACEKATCLLGIDASCFYIHHGDSDSFVPACSSGLVLNSFKTIRNADLGASLSEHIFSGENPLWEPRKPETVPTFLTEPYKASNSLIATIRLEEGFTGFLYIVRYHPEMFDATEKLLLGNLASRIIIGLENDSIMKKKEEKEVQLKKALRELERSNKELEIFAYVISHDLQEPLRMVKGFLDLLFSRCKDSLDEKGREYIEFAVDGSTRMQNMIKGLLAYSRIDKKGHIFGDTDCGAIVNEIKNNLIFVIKEKQAIITAAPLPVIMADHSQISQLFQNIIQNSIKFTVPGNPPVISISAVEKDSFWEFRIRDNGIGIDPRFKDRIFTIFERLHTAQEYPGTGIGLAICKRIVERHGGRIWVESEPEAGATFYFTVPTNKLSAE